MFYSFAQTNSKGRIIESSDLALFVVMEADDPFEADKRAEKLGIYFDGVRDGKDCSCCGDRWNRAGKGTEEPLIWSSRLEAIVRQFRGMGVEKAAYVIHYLDGSKVDSRLRDRLPERTREYTDV